MKSYHTAPPNPSGLCMCGCGEATTISPKGSRRYGHVKGEPRRFRPGHVSRTLPSRVPPIAQGHNWKLEDRGYATPCWTWQRALSKKGYATAWSHLRKKAIGAHIASYEEAVGPVPAGLQIDHLCKNRACVNPSHLEAVTPLVNSRRRYDAKLTDAKREDILYLYDRGHRVARIAVLFSVDPGTIRNVLRVARRLAQDGGKDKRELVY